MIVKHLPYQTIFFLFVVRQYCKIDREASSKANYILPIRRQTLLRREASSKSNIPTSSEGVVKLIVKRLPNQTISSEGVVKLIMQRLLPIRRQKV